MKNSGLQRGLNPWPRDTIPTLYPTELWSRWRWELVICRFQCSREEWINDEMIYQMDHICELRIWNQVKLWSSQLWTQFLQLRREAWKIQDFNGVWTRDLAIPVRRSNQLSYKATDAGSWSFVGSNVPVRNESMMKWYMKWIIYIHISRISLHHWPKVMVA